MSCVIPPSDWINFHANWKGLGERVCSILVCDTDNPLTLHVRVCRKCSAKMLASLRRAVVNDRVRLTSPCDSPSIMICQIACPYTATQVLLDHRLFENACSSMHRSNAYEVPAHVHQFRSSRDHPHAPSIGSHSLSFSSFLP